MHLTVLDTTRAPTIPATLPALETGPRSIAAVRMLRISVTDRCNFRCTYCMPEAGVPWLAKEDILNFEEIAAIVRAAVQVHGIRRFKLTGGEPTVRHNVAELVRLLRTIDDVEELSLTTNGMLLSELARPLKDAGLDRVTVSLDSLRPDRFRRITRTGDLSAVLQGLDRCEQVGFRGLKINCVTMRGINDDEFADFARLTLHRDLTIRFIEYMPLGDAALQTAPTTSATPDVAQVAAGQRTRGTIADSQIASEELGPAGGCGAQDRGADAFIPEPEIRERIEREFGPLVPVERSTEPGVGPAIPYRLARGNPRGRIGFISAMSQPFCSTCNRLRLTATGVLRSCLFEGGEVDVRSILRDPASSNREQRQHAIAQAMTDCVRLKPEVHSHHGNEQMSRIGG